MSSWPFDGTWAGFRAAARLALAAREAPTEAHFLPPTMRQGALSLAPVAAPVQPAKAPALRLPRAYVEAAAVAARHNDPARWALLYRLAYRLTNGEPLLLQQAYDGDVQRLSLLLRAVQRDVHKCHAFVRFREVPSAAQPEAAPPGALPARRTFVAWYEPEHDVLELSVPHFVERFAGMNWSILTPRACATFVDGELRFGPGTTREKVPGPDATEALWATYYRHIFNPARLNLRATRAEMPQRFWKNLPETALIGEMRREAPARTAAFVAAQPRRAEPQTSYADGAALGRDVAACTVCPWSCQSTQAVLGEGPQPAPLMLVGEQPGDVEDVRGRPFVGPAGEVLARAMADAGVVRAESYLTNAVKHFKFTPRGKRRLHQRPSPADVAACRGWLTAELALVRPKVLVCLGTTAALAVRGQATRLHAVRGEWLQSAGCARTRVTLHPSAVLRAAPAERDGLYAGLVTDLRAAQAAASAPDGASSTSW